MILEDKLFGRKYRIKVEEHQYLLQKKYTSEKGEDYWDNLGYYTTLSGALKKMIRIRVLAARTVKNLEDYVSRYEQIHRQLQKRFDF